VAVITIFKQNKKTAVTSVKGGKAMVRAKTSPKSATGLRSVVPVMKAKAKAFSSKNGIANMSGRYKERSIPVTRNYYKTVANHTYSSVNVDGCEGVRVRGTMFLDDLVSYAASAGGSIPTRFISERYLHPALLSGRLAKVAETFQKFRFDKIRVVFVSAVSTASAGTIHLAVLDDVLVDPTILQDRQIKMWNDSMEGTFSGNVYTEENLSWTEADLSNQPFLHVDRNQSDLENVSQAKICVSVTNTTPATYLGELYIDFDVIFCDDYLSLSTLSSLGTQNPSKTLGIPAVAVNTVVGPVTGLGTYANTPVGLYSVINKQDDSTSLGKENFLNKLYDFGSEMILNVVANGPTPTGFLFNSFSDFIRGDRTISTIANSAFPHTVLFQYLLGNSLGAAGGPPQVPPAYAIHKGHQVCLEAVAEMQRQSLLDREDEELILSLKEDPPARRTDHSRNESAEPSRSTQRILSLSPISRSDREQLQSQRTPGTPTSRPEGRGMFERP